ncbi:DAK2 domain-containing protein [Cellulomonas sp. P24]|uniref:DAK2 domain-containing protein n=1 Tax=Cellulomonas sp. P24 TaxID=2885206 RepID=UPI00216B2530|nr:DAK2 domain-containing protein [Cellulomonas sp. P24]MCR6494015.1 DAK2 domain-containing protein [Cellulomonas sp. P24]
MDQLDADVVRRWAADATSALGSARARIDAVNVFPVPDSDTGTNVYLTVASGAEALTRGPEVMTVADAAVTFARGAVVGARGNSGVIVSQYLEGLALSFEAVRGTEVGPVELAGAFEAAQLAARAAVAEPVEGTVLTAATRAAGAARARADRGGSLAEVLVAAVDEAHGCVQESRDLLPALRAAGVVDAGAWAFMVLLDALRVSVEWPGHGGRPTGIETASFDGIAASPEAGEQRTDAGAERPHGGEFEVMYLVEPGAEENDDLGAVLSGRLQAVGDSVAVVGGHGVWQVHVHTDDPARAILAGELAAQRQITVRDLALQLPGASPAATGRGSGGGLGVVVGTRARGLVADLARTGAVVHLLTDRAPGVDEIARAVVDTGCTEVLVLPGDDAALAAARLLVSERVLTGTVPRVHVLPAVDDVAVVVALAAVVESRAEDATTRVGIVDDALRGLRTIVVDATTAVEAVMTALADGVPRLVTVLAGDQVDTEMLDALAEAVATRRPACEVVVLGVGVGRTELVIGLQPLVVPGTTS